MSCPATRGWIAPDRDQTDSARGCGQHPWTLPLVSRRFVAIAMDVAGACERVPAGPLRPVTPSMDVAGIPRAHSRWTAEAPSWSRETRCNIHGCWGECARGSRRYPWMLAVRLALVWTAATAVAALGEPRPQPRPRAGGGWRLREESGSWRYRSPDDVCIGRLEAGGTAGWKPALPQAYVAAICRILERRRPGGRSAGFQPAKVRMDCGDAVAALGEPRPQPRPRAGGGWRLREESGSWRYRSPDAGFQPAMVQSTVPAPPPSFETVRTACRCRR